MIDVITNLIILLLAPFLFLALGASYLIWVVIKAIKFFILERR